VHRQSEDQDHFDLQAMVAVMLCLLGTLLLITMSMASINIGAGAAEGWVPSTSQYNSTKTPLLVEWDGETATIHHGAGFERITLGKEVGKWWNSDYDFKNRKMLAFLNRMIEHSDSSYVLFAVRPSGFDNFQSLAQEFRAKEVEVGFEPIEQAKAVRLKLKEKANP